MEASDLETSFARLREEMVSTQLQSRGIEDLRVLDAMRRVPRHLFVPEDLRHRAYEDSPLPIGHGQTISQPYIVAFMTECLGLKGEGRVLEIGTGSGYQTAILAELANEVFSLEIVPDLSNVARERLGNLGYTNIRVGVGDGRKGWPEIAPFEAILAAASAETVPPDWLEQMAAGGRLILPLGQDQQDLWIYSEGPEKTVPRRLLPVRFVPLVHG